MTFRMLRKSLPALLALPALYMLAHASLAGEAVTAVPAPATDLPAAKAGPQKAVLAGGCFWGMQGMFEHVKGVKQVVAGYAGGKADTAQYETVSGGGTGHAESVEITYDPAVISYGRLLQLYFSVAHDPTQVDSQGPDSGTQYRSAIFYADPAQQRVGEAYIAEIDRAHVFAKPIATHLEPLRGFYPAENYHQDYLIHHPSNPYIVFNDLPKIGNLQQAFPDRFRSDPVTVDARS